MITPEEERAWITWWVDHPEEKAELDSFQQEQEPLMTQAKQLLESGEQPASPTVQALLSKWTELLLRHKVRERNRRLRAWNTSITEKWMGLGAKMGSIKYGAQLAPFWAAAMRHSPWGNALREVLRGLRGTMQKESDPSSAAFDEPVRRIQAICAEFGLGDALLLAEWRRFNATFYAYHSSGEETFNSEWEFIEQALRARESRALSE